MSNETRNGQLLDRHKIAERLGVTVWAVDKWRRRKDFPAIVDTYGQSPVWREVEIVAWAEKTGRL